MRQRRHLRNPPQLFLPSQTQNRRHQRRNAHQRAVPIIPFSIHPGNLRRHPISQVLNGSISRHTYIKCRPLGCPQTFFHPINKLIANIPQIIPLTQRIRQTQRQRSIIRPTGMPRVHPRHRAFLHLLPGNELHRKTQRIAHSRPQKNSLDNMPLLQTSPITPPNPSASLLPALRHPAACPVLRDRFPLAFYLTFPAKQTPESQSPFSCPILFPIHHAIFSNKIPHQK